MANDSNASELFSTFQLTTLCLHCSAAVKVMHDSMNSSNPKYTSVTVKVSILFIVFFSLFNVYRLKLYPS